MSPEIVASFLNFCAVYLAVQFGRCVLCSGVVLTVVLVLRRTLLKKNVFTKGMVWSVFLLVPFVGKLKVFYKNPILVKSFFWWNDLCVEFPWICWLYLLGILVSAWRIFLQRWKLRNFVQTLKLCSAEQRNILVSQGAVTPFSTGLLHPKIVVPETLLEQCTEEEIMLILLHEQNHIQLGHLWCYFLWDVLGCLLWPNVFLKISMKYLKEDMEDICDRVTIQRSGKMPLVYGKLLLKTIGLLQEEPLAGAAAFSGEKEYGALKERMEKVVGYRPYLKSQAVCLCTAVIVFLAGGFAGIYHGSYPKYTAADMYIMVDSSGERVLINDSDRIKKVFTVDSESLHIRRRELEILFRDYGVEEEDFYLGFGGYMKLPGMGGGGNCVYVDCREKGDVLTIPYYSQESILNEILKWL